MVSQNQNGLPGIRALTESTTCNNVVTISGTLDATAMCTIFSITEVFPLREVLVAVRDVTRAIHQSNGFETVTSTPTINFTQFQHGSNQKDQT
jgi:hypothetical protein